MRKLGQRGEGRLQLIVWLAIIGLGIFVGVKAIPVRVNVMQLHDYIEDQLRAAAASPRQPDEARIIKEILDKAAFYGIPLEKKQMKLAVSPNELTMTLKHKVVVDLGFYQWQWDYDKRFQNTRF